MAWSLAWSPLVPLWLLIAAGLACALWTLAALLGGNRGAVLRMLALVALLVALANPVAVHEERKPERDIALLVVDRSASQALGEREAQSEKARAALAKAIGADATLELRELALGQSGDGTEIFGPLARALGDLPRERLAGIVIVTDGQIHDIPANAQALGVDAPVHALITGSPQERDRKLTILQAPVYGIVDEPVSLTLRIDDLGAKTGAAATADVTVWLDGREQETRTIEIGREITLQVPLKHGGQNVIEVETPAVPGELTAANNRAVVTTNGVRDRLRVLLVTGEPHAGERTWRNLLKADPAVDLVHFTILRPPEKQDGTPIDELSLIAFPTRELFAEKLDEFDLIIFDRYRRRGVLPLAYLANVAEYVEQGGALLDAAGPAFATGLSLYRTPLAAVLPAQPTGGVVEKGFRVRLTEEGLRHPVTAGLVGANTTADGEPTWGRWFRLIESAPVAGETLMTGPGREPALVLDRVGEGRVAQLLSDQSWLWARGFENGGPQAELLRRLAHWLMKEPELEEEVLSGEVRQGELFITRRTMANSSAPVTVTRPDQSQETLALSADGPGLFRGRTKAPMLGLYRLDDGQVSAVAAGGPLNPRELSDVRATGEALAPLVAATGGRVVPLASLRADAPSVRRVRPGRTAGGSDWIGLRQNDRYTVSAVTNRPLLPAPLALALIAGLFGLAWYREGR